MLLLVQVVALGVIWPSALTIAAIVTLPAVYICLRGLIASRTDRVPVAIYSAASGLVAAGALLAEAITLSVRT